MTSQLFHVDHPATGNWQHELSCLAIHAFVLKPKTRWLDNRRFPPQAGLVLSNVGIIEMEQRIELGRNLGKYSVFELSGFRGAHLARLWPLVFRRPATNAVAR